LSDDLWTSLLCEAFRGKALDKGQRNGRIRCNGHEQTVKSNETENNAAEDGSGRGVFMIYAIGHRA